MFNASRYRVNANARERLDICRLPAVASEYWTRELGLRGWTPTLREFLTGICLHEVNNSQGTCYLSLLRGQENTLGRKIYSFLLPPEFAKYVKLTIPATHVGRLRDSTMVRYNGGIHTLGRSQEDIEGQTSTKSTYPSDFVAWTTCGKIDFPPPKNRNVNMMPFIFGDMSSLPIDLRCFAKCIKACPVSPSDIGKVFYLTVQETYVDPESTQRREGLHIEAPGTLLEEGSPAFSPGPEHHWGIGIFYGPDEYEGEDCFL